MKHIQYRTLNRSRRALKPEWHNGHSVTPSSGVHLGSVLGFEGAEEVAFAGEVDCVEGSWPVELVLPRCLAGLGDLESDTGGDAPAVVSCS
jgi:hypothetical protein